MENENEEQLVYDASDPQQVNNARKKAGRVKYQSEHVVKTILSTPEGRTWMYELLTLCSTFTHSHSAGDSHSTAFNCGRQSIGHALLAYVMAASPEKYPIMCSENGLKKRRE